MMGTTIAMTDSPADGKPFGSDVICTRADRLVIFAAQPMDWPAREFCRVPVFVEGRKYFLHSRGGSVPPFAASYELHPWPKELRDASTEEIHYTKHYIAERDCAAARQRRGDAINFLLLPLYPLLGLFWSGFKRRVLHQAGFEPSSITKASVVMLFHLWIVEGIFVGWLQGGLLMLFFPWATNQWADWIFLFVIGADTVMRASDAIKSGPACHLGFLEWLWPWRNSEP